MNITTQIRQVKKQLKKVFSKRIPPHERRTDLQDSMAAYFSGTHDHPYQKELDYYSKNGIVSPFPYEKASFDSLNIEAGIDKKNGLPFVVHKTRRLYFHKGFTLEKAIKAYKGYILSEKILETGTDPQAPHQYQSGLCMIEQGDVLLDVGGAEGLFLLDNIDKVSKGVIFEASPVWKTALEATFSEFKQKVDIIYKYVSNTDDENNISIDTYCADISAPVFLKMDVEGYEKLVLEGAQKTLKEHKGIKVACCTYHKDGDAQMIKQFLEKLGFQTEFSTGHMLYYADRDMKPPFFRKGLIRGIKTGL